MKNPFFISVGGGKGGVGKTFFSTSIGVFLAESGFKTLIIDFDLGGANVHTFLGMEPSSFCLDRAIDDKRKLRDIITPSPVRDLYVIMGTRENYRSASIKTFTKERLLNEIRKMDFDCIIADLGAGTSLFTLDVFVNSDLSIGIVSPESTSMEKFFHFMKCVFYRKVELLWRKYKRYFKDFEADVGHIGYPERILNLLEMHSPEGGNLIRREVEEMRLGVVVNMVMRREEANVGDVMKRLIRTYLGLDIYYIGWIPFSNEARPEINGGVPLINRIKDWSVKQAFSQIALSIKKFYEGRNNGRKLLPFAWSKPGGY